MNHTSNLVAVGTETKDSCLLSISNLSHTLSLYNSLLTAHRKPKVKSLHSSTIQTLSLIPLTWNNVLHEEERKGKKEGGPKKERYCYILF
jgi:hypothetical protein